MVEGGIDHRPHTARLCGLKLRAKAQAQPENIQQIDGTEPDFFGIRAVGLECTFLIISAERFQGVPR